MNKNKKPSIEDFLKKFTSTKRFFVKIKNRPYLIHKNMLEHATFYFYTPDLANISTLNYSGAVHVKFTKLRSGDAGYKLKEKIFLEKNKIIREYSFIPV